MNKARLCPKAAGAARRTGRFDGAEYQHSRGAPIWLEGGDLRTTPKQAPFVPLNRRIRND